MANITEELQTIATAVYGSEMRTAIHDAIEKVNEYGTGYTDSAEVTFGTAGETPFTGYIRLAKFGGVISIAEFTLVPMFDVPYVRPEGTIIDTTGITLFTLPEGFGPGDVCDYKFYITPNASDAHNGDRPYIELKNTDPVVKLYYGWNDVLTDDWPAYHTTGTYFGG